MGRTTVVDVIAEVLNQANIAHVWGYEDVRLKEIERRLGRSRWHAVPRQLAARCAAGEAEISSIPGVCIGVRDTKHPHFLEGLIDIKHDRLPVLALVVEPVSSLSVLTSLSTAATEMGWLSKRYCDYLVRVDRAERAAEIIGCALRIALLNRSTSVVVIPQALLDASVETLSVVWTSPVEPLQRPPDHVLDHLAAMLEYSKRVVLVRGKGCERADTALFALAKRLAAPVVHTLVGRQEPDSDHVLDFGVCAADTPGERIVMEADCVLLLGAGRFEQIRTRGLMVHLDVNANANDPSMALSIAAETRVTLEGLLEKLMMRDDHGFLEWAKTLRANSAERHTNARYLDTQLIRALDVMTGNDAIFVIDEALPELMRDMRLDGRRRLVVVPRQGVAATLARAVGIQSVSKRQVFVISTRDIPLDEWRRLTGQLCADSSVKVVVWGEKAGMEAEPSTHRTAPDVHQIRLASSDALAAMRRALAESVSVLIKLYPAMSSQAVVAPDYQEEASHRPASGF